MLKSKSRAWPIVLFALSLGVATAIVVGVDPARGELWQLALLYLAVFTLVYALVLLIVPHIRKQAALVALLTVAALLLLAQGMFTPTSGILLLALFVLIELYAISR
ncbi:MAG: hypothetical protein HY398_01520 [Candidatus Doudnabacteria bacterium]|nr:hypothetical protein [Candidatus Doudnabacteria bacterium]